MRSSIRGCVCEHAVLKRSLRHPSFAIGALLVLLLSAAALLSLVWSPYPPADIDIANKLAAPSAAHWLGTDSLGRDIASQLLVGAQNSIAVGVVAVGIGVLLGVAHRLPRGGAARLGRRAGDAQPAISPSRFRRC